MPLPLQASVRSFYLFCEPKNDGVSRNSIKCIVVENKEMDIFTLKTRDLTQEEEHTESHKFRQPQRYNTEFAESRVKPLQTNVISIDPLKQYSTDRKPRTTIPRRGRNHAPKSFDLTNTNNSRGAAVYYRTTQNPTPTAVTPKQKRRPAVRLRCQKLLDTFIKKCTEVESQIGFSNQNSAAAVSWKVKCDQESQDVKWAVKEYVANLSGQDWQNAKGIDFLMQVRDDKKVVKMNLFDPEMIDNIKASMTKRLLLMSSLGRKKVWKPSRYVPSRQVVLANSIEEIGRAHV